MVSLAWVPDPVGSGDDGIRSIFNDTTRLPIWAGCYTTLSSYSHLLHLAIRTLKFLGSRICSATLIGAAIKLLCRAVGKQWHLSG